jgi:Sulfotransferase family
MRSPIHSDALRKSDRRPILITGSPRCGSTWVGKMLAQSRSVKYVHEPFNGSQRRCACGVSLPYWFPYVSRANEGPIHKHIAHCVRCGLDAFNMRNVLGDMVRTRHLRPLRAYLATVFAERPLLKDPLAVFSAEWLVSSFQMNAVVVIRHPAAVVSSYKALNWSHPFEHFLAQPALMRDHLWPFEAQIRQFAARPPDVVDQASLLWLLVHHVIRGYKQAHPDWTLVRHEDLSRNPIAAFEPLFGKVGLEFCDGIAQTIVAHTRVADAAGEQEDPYSVKRDSASNIDRWRQHLTLPEIRRIRERVEIVSSAFYSDDDW